jgi:hypothetical protein
MSLLKSKSDCWWCKVICVTVNQTLCSHDSKLTLINWYDLSETIHCVALLFWDSLKGKRRLQTLRGSPKSLLQKEMSLEW